MVSIVVKRVGLSKLAIYLGLTSVNIHSSFHFD